MTTGNVVVAGRLRGGSEAGRAPHTGRVAQRPAALALALGAGYQAYLVFGGWFNPTDARPDDQRTAHLQPSEV